MAEVIRDFETGLTADEVRRLFRYVKKSGLLFRREPVLTHRGGVRHAVGSVSGSLHADGYIYIGINKRLYLAHRLAYLYVNGKWPDAEVDHKNGNRSDNRWVNLRDADTSQNRRNTLGQKSRIGPYPGVYEPARRPGRFLAQIKCKGKVHYLGTFNSAELARDARVRAEKRMFGSFAGSAREV